MESRHPTLSGKLLHYTQPSFTFVSRFTLTFSVLLILISLACIFVDYALLAPVTVDMARRCFHVPEGKTRLNVLATMCSQGSVGLAFVVYLGFLVYARMGLVYVRYLAYWVNQNVFWVALRAVVTAGGILAGNPAAALLIDMTLIPLALAALDVFVLLLGLHRFSRWSVMFMLLNLVGLSLSTYMSLVTKRYRCSSDSQTRPSDLAFVASFFYLAASSALQIVNLKLYMRKFLSPLRPLILFPGKGLYKATDGSGERDAAEAALIAASAALVSDVARSASGGAAHLRVAASPPSPLSADRVRHVELHLEPNLLRIVPARDSSSRRPAWAPPEADAPSVVTAPDIIAHGQRMRRSSSNRSGAEDSPLVQPQMVTTVSSGSHASSLGLGPSAEATAAISRLSLPSDAVFARAALTASLVLSVSAVMYISTGVMRFTLARLDLTQRCFHVEPLPLFFRVLLIVRAVVLMIGLLLVLSFFFFRASLGKFYARFTLFWSFRKRVFAFAVLPGWFVARILSDTVNVSDVLTAFSVVPILSGVDAFTILIRKPSTALSLTLRLCLLTLVLDFISAYFYGVAQDGACGSENLTLSQPAMVFIVSKISQILNAVICLEVATVALRKIYSPSSPSFTFGASDKFLMVSEGEP